jgi:glycine dehydrogenase subunit 2
MRENFHAARWDEPLVMELGAPGRRGAIIAAPGDEAGADLVPESMRRAAPPDLPELSEHDVLRHYLHLAQETLGMLGVSLFGTCTVKYNPRVAEQLVARPQVAEVHPYQDPSTIQGLLEIVYRLDRILRELSGMDQFVFQPGGGANAAYTHACVTRAYHAARGELETRREVITTIQSHPCNPATAAAAGFDVITLPLEEHGYPSLEALKAAVSERTAALMVGNPDDMGIYNPQIREWVRVVHDAGALAFYDHANFNGVMGKLRARELGFDACMYMLHKTFGAPKTGGGGPATGAYGCSAELAPFLPVPLVGFDGERYTLEVDRPHSIGKIREFMGNLPVVVRAYAWARGMGADGISEASDLSVLANNYMATRLAAIRGITISHPHIDGPRMEMTRWSLEQLREDTGVGVVDVANRMADFGIDGPWLSHHPWLVPEPITPEAGELWSREDIDEWCDVLERVCGEAYADPEFVRSAPHRSVIHQVDASGGEDPDQWATTWRAYQRKHRVPSRI